MTEETWPRFRRRARNGRGYRWPAPTENKEIAERFQESTQLRTTAPRASGRAEKRNAFRHPEAPPTDARARCDPVPGNAGLAVWQNFATGALARRSFLGLTGLLATARIADAALPPQAMPTVRLGVLAFGTVRWVASIIVRHRLDRAEGLTLKIETLANNDSAKVALLGDSVELIVSDWLFVGAERARGLKLRFAPFSSASGAIVLGRNSTIRSFKDFSNKRLGVAGGPFDKSWMIVRAAAKRENAIDLARAADIVYAAPPLLSAKLKEGALDAVLTYWNYAAALEVAGFHPLVSVSDCAKALGLPAHPPLIGYVFRETWAARNNRAIAGFLAASRAAENLLVRSDAAWLPVRPLMHAADDRLFALLKERFRAGVVPVNPAEEEKAAERLFAILHEEGGTAATGGLTRLPPGVFWPAPS
ncbi:MAG: ABC transporter substrate-binding protein [Acetobacteraceae bacterium]